MKKILVPFLLFALTGCTKEIINETFIKYSERVEFTAAEQDKTFTLSDITTQNWSIEEVEQDWLTAEKQANQSILIKVRENSDIEREAYITIREGNIENRIRVYQDRARFIDVEEEVSLEASGASRNIMIETNLATTLKVQVTSDNSSWVKTSLSGQTIAVSADPYRGATSRHATAEVTGYSEIGEFVAKSFTITQSTDGVIEYVFDIPEFTQSWVYKVMYNGVQIAEVCKEFIHDNGLAPAASLQAIVVYPMGTDGKADLTEGFVAQVLKMREDSSQSYPAPTTDIHGGSVGWDLVGNCVDAFHHYTNGTLPKVRRVFISSDKGITAEGDYYAAEYASTEAYVVRDKRGDEKEFVYPVVKIATQYWLQKSLMTGRNRDGSRIATNLANAAWAAPYYATPRNAIPACCVYGYADVENPAAQAIREDAGVLYSFPAINGENFLNESGQIVMSFDGNNNATVDNISPEGWGVPDIVEMRKMFIYIGGTVAETYVPGTNVCRVREYLNPDGSWNNVSGRDDENITGLSLRVNNYRSGTGAFQASAHFFIWSRTYDPTIVDTNAPAARYFNSNGEYGMNMMRGYSIRSIRR